MLFIVRMILFWILWTNFKFLFFIQLHQNLLCWQNWNAWTLERPLIAWIDELNDFLSNFLNLRIFFESISKIWWLWHWLRCVDSLICVIELTGLSFHLLFIKLLSSSQLKTFKYGLTINQAIKNRVLQKHKMIDYSDVKSNFKKLLSPATFL